MKVVAVIPIKMNSKRLKNKNLLPFGDNETLLSNICKIAEGCKGVDETYVFSSSEYLEEHITNNVKYLKRDEKFDSDTTSMNEILYDFSLKVDADVYVLIHATAPFIKSSTIDEAITNVKGDDCDSSFAVRPLKEFLWDEKNPINYNPSRIPRTQDLTGYYYETSSFYVFQKDILQNDMRRIGYTPKKIIISELESIDIDEKIDYDYALLKRAENNE